MSAFVLAVLFALAAQPAAHQHRGFHCRCTETGRKWLAAHPEVSPAAVAGAPAPATQDAPPFPDRERAAAGESGAPVRAVPAAWELPRPGQLHASRDESRTDDAIRPASLYQLSPVGDGVVVAASALTAVFPWAFSSRLIRPQGAGDPGSLNALDRSVVGNSSLPAMWASDVTMLAALAVPLALDFADQGATSVFLEDAVVLTEVVGVTSALSSVSRTALQRRAPALYGASGGVLASNPVNYGSPLSMQTSVAFAALSTAAFTLSERYDQKVWPWVATALAGGTVAAERIAGGRAFYTDVLAGAAVGVAAGTIIPWLHLRKGFTGTIMPTDGGLALGTSQRF